MSSELITCELCGLEKVAHTGVCIDCNRDSEDRYRKQIQEKDERISEINEFAGKQERKISDLKAKVEALTAAFGCDDIEIARADGDGDGKGFPDSLVLKRGDEYRTYTAYRWISVNTRMPEYETDFVYRDENGELYLCECADFSDIVTHMPTNGAVEWMEIVHE